MSGIILALPQEERRDRLANLVLLRRLTAYSRRISAEKVALMAMAVAVTVASNHRLAAWLVLAPALVGTVLNLLAVLVTQRSARGRVLERYEEHLATIEGHPRLNLPGAVECVGAIVLVAGSAWVVTDLSGGVRLLYVAVATFYACLVSITIFDDNAWYNPAVRSPRRHEIARVLCGVQIVALVLVATWWAPWDPVDRIGLIVVAVFGMIVPLRAGGTQLLVNDLEPLVEAERRHGTRLVIEETTRELLPVLLELKQTATALGPEGEQVRQLADSALEGMSDLPQQVAHAAGHGERPPLAVVVGRLRTLAEAARCQLTVTLPPDLDLPEEDRALASLALRDLTGNAISATPSRIHLELRRIGPRILVVVADDGRPFPAGAWKAPGSSSAALEARLIERSGSLTAESGPATKVVIATWNGAG